jgi:hypothetical protein
MIRWIEGIYDSGLFKGLRDFPGGLEQNHEKSYVILFSAWIRTWYKPNAVQTGDHCFNPFGAKLFNDGVRGCIQKFPDWVDNEINNNNNKHSLRSNTKGYGGKTHYTDSQNSDTSAPSGKELYHSQFSLQAASPETSG